MVYRSVTAEVVVRTPVMPAPVPRTPSFIKSASTGRCLMFKGRLCNHICVDDSSVRNLYRCECKPGFEKNKSNPRFCNRKEGAKGYVVGRDDTTLIDPIACSVMCSYRCDQVSGQCYCSSGYELGVDQASCRDVNECLSGQHTCRGQEKCVNRVGSYECTSYRCPQGYVSSQTDRAYCEEVNECHANPSMCQHGSSCESFRGRYQCRRVIGSPTTTRARDTTSTTRSTTTTTRATTTTTRASIKYNPKGNKQSTITGKCPKGFDPTSDGRCERFWCPNGYSVNKQRRICEDIDECRTNPCSYGLKCVNTPGAFLCRDTDHNTMKPAPISGRGERCQPGNERNHNDVCVDIDECTRGTHTCAEKGMTCLNTRNGYSCKCKEGFTYDSPTKRCIDINECLYMNRCGDGSECSNTVGSYECHCKRGFVETNNPNQCRDIDECESNSHGCSDYCFNYWGGYQCSCKLGYRMGTDNRTCVDINECNPAEVNGRRNLCQGECVNTPGGYECGCPTGFKKVNNMCIDIDECRNRQTICGDNKVCVNVPGSYQCHKVNCVPGSRFESEHNIGMRNKAICSARMCGASTCTSLKHMNVFFIVFYDNMVIPSKFFQITQHTLSADARIDYDYHLRQVGHLSNGVTPMQLSDFKFERVGTSMMNIHLIRKVMSPQHALIRITTKTHYVHSSGTKRVDKIIHDINIIAPGSGLPHRSIGGK